MHKCVFKFTYSFFFVLNGVNISLSSVIQSIYVYKQYIFFCRSVSLYFFLFCFVSFLKYTVIGNVEMFVVVERHHDQQFERIEIGIFVYNNNNNININNKRGKEWRERERNPRHELPKNSANLHRFAECKGWRCFIRMNEGGGAWREGGVRASKQSVDLNSDFLDFLRIFKSVKECRRITNVLDL